MASEVNPSFLCLYPVLGWGSDICFCTDSTVGGAQAFGEIGVCDPDDSYRLLRGTFQALQAALPENALHWQHVSSHTGLLYNEFADLAAKHEVSASFHHPRGVHRDDQN